MQDRAILLALPAHHDDGIFEVMELTKSFLDGMKLIIVKQQALCVKYKQELQCGHTGPEITKMRVDQL